MPQQSARDQIELEAYVYDERIAILCGQDEPTEEYKQLAKDDVERVRREMEGNW